MKQQDYPVYSGFVQQLLYVRCLPTIPTPTVWDGHAGVLVSEYRKHPAMSLARIGCLRSRAGALSALGGVVAMREAEANGFVLAGERQFVIDTEDP
eukprot:4971257-Alexandrium_andersonii.AAC.1